MQIHLYALCWNEAEMLPFFFQYYDAIVDQYYIYDNHSDDGSIEILKQHPKVELNTFNVTSDSFVLDAMEFYNHAWKQSRGTADWIIIINIDEHLFHPNLRGYLEKCLYHSHTIIPSIGYEMVSDNFPVKSKLLYEQIAHGELTPFISKTCVFNPNAIEEINFDPGRHHVDPVGRIIYPITLSMKLLHYKYIGLNYLITRFSELGARLKQLDKDNGFGYQYLEQQQDTIKKFELIKKSSVLAITENELFLYKLIANSVSQSNEIDGVKIKSLKLIHNDRGGLLEIQRHDEAIYPGFGQAYITRTFPDIIKAWYRHHSQVDQIALIQGKMKLVLYDNRPQSKTHGVVQEIYVEEKEPMLIQIPTLIWHGFQALGNQNLLLLHLNDQAFDFDKPDEDRLSIDNELIPYQW